MTWPSLTRLRRRCVTNEGGSIVCLVIGAVSADSYFSGDV